jgi:Escherichia/Staphylococcus phage prohead protease
MSTIEQTVVTVPVKWTATRTATASRKLIGYASVFDVPADRLGFGERIQRGAFTDAIRDGDPFLVYAHEDTAILARKSAGTLRLSEDTKGLRIEADVVNTTLGNDVLELVRTGHLTEMSFAMSDVEDSYVSGERVVTRVGRLWEVTVCPLGAYSQTSVQARASQALADRVARVTGTTPIRVRERGPYGPESKFSFYRDLVVTEEARQAKEARFGSQAFEYPASSSMEDNLHGTLDDAKKRLASVQQRDIGTTAFDNFVPVTAGGAFVGSLFATSARARAVVASTLTQGDLPRGGMTVTVPRLTTSATAATHVELAAVSETDPGTSQQSGTVQFVAGQVDLAQQLFDQSPGGSIDQAISQTLGEAVGAAIDQNVLAAILAAIAAGTTVTYTDATPTVAETWGQIVNLRQQVHTALGVEPDLLLLHPRRLAYIDQTLTNPLPFRERIISTPSITTTAGAGAEDRIWILASQYISLLSRPPELKVMFEVLSSTLTVRIQAYQATALVIRQPKAVGLLTGSGLTTPSFPAA